MILLYDRGERFSTITIMLRTYIYICGGTTRINLTNNQKNFSKIMYKI